MAGAVDLLKGTVTWFDVRRGFGFITPEDGGENLFVHQSSIKAVGYRSLAVGEAVEFVVSVGDDGRRRAVSVTGPGGAYIKGRRYFGGACYRCGEVGHMAMDCKSNGVCGRIGPCYSCGMMGHLARECSTMRIEPSSSRSNFLKPSKLGSISSFSPSLFLPSDCGKKDIRTLFDKLSEDIEGEEEEEEEDEEVVVEEEEEEINDYDSEFPKAVEQRNWAELPRDVLSLIFKKITAVEIIRSAQFVCRPWRQLSHEPDLWRYIVVTMPDERMDMTGLESLAMLAIERSKGCVEEFHLECFGSENDELLDYMSERATALRRLHLISIYNLSEIALAQAVRKFPLLEEFEISFCYFSPELVESVGLACPKLKIFRLNAQPYKDPYDYDSDSDGNSDAEALMIAKHMRQLHHLQLIGNSLTNIGLLAILDNCPNLQYLDIRGCLNVNLDENMKKKCAMIRELRLPKDSTADYEFNALIVGPEGLFDGDFDPTIYDSEFVDHLFQIQSQIIIHGLLQNRHLAPKVAIAYFESSNLQSARQLFDQILEPDTVIWNVMFKGYTEAGFHKETLLLFSQMKRRDVRPNLFTLTSVIKSCSMMPALMVGDQLHCIALKTGLRSNVFVGTALIGLYASMLDAGLAHKMFEDLPEKNVVVWTAIIKAYIAIGDMRSAFYLFNQLEEHDVILWDTMISAYIEHGDITTANELFARMPVRDVKSWNTILLGYGNWEDIEVCERFFAIMPERNVFSWNGLIGGYARHGKFSDVLDVFHHMLISTNIKPNDATLMLVLSSCSKLGALTWGKWIHLYSENNGFKENIYIGNGLIDMYAKCGCIHSAINVFTAMEKRDVITWNSMISGLAMHGMGLEALELFDQMLDTGEKPDGITFVGVLSACVHMGLVERGFTYFRSMAKIYSIAPWIEHYGCMVDLLGRSGLLYEAIGFVKDMPMKPDDVIWSALLGACRAWRHVYLAEIAMSRLVRLMPDDAANYVVLSNIYGDDGRWKDVGRLQKALRRMGAGKSPGCSLVEVNMEVFEFCSSDARHARSKDIYEILESLADISRFAVVESTLEELL